MLWCIYIFILCSHSVTKKENEARKCNYRQLSSNFYFCLWSLLVANAAVHGNQLRRLMIAIAIISCCFGVISSLVPILNLGFLFLLTSYIYSRLLICHLVLILIYFRFCSYYSPPATTLLFSSSSSSPSLLFARLPAKVERQSRLNSGRRSPCRQYLRHVASCNLGEVS